MSLSEEALQHAHAHITGLRAEIAKALVGQTQVVDDVMSALLCDGHVLLEGVPGVGKTLLVKALGKAMAAQFRRVQFTPDLMPSDVIGHTFFDAATSRFITRQGPVFTNLLLADEINRAPAKTQSALLEAMQERQVTLEGSAIAAPSTVHGAGDAESHRAGGHVSPALKRNWTGSSSRSASTIPPPRKR